MMCHLIFKPVAHDLHQLLYVGNEQAITPLDLVSLFITPNCFPFSNVR